MSAEAFGEIVNLDHLGYDENRFACAIDSPSKRL